MNYGASTPRFNDGFDDRSSGWGTGSNEGGSVAYGDGTLEVETAANHAWEYTHRLTGGTDNAVYAETLWTPKGSGYYGLLCASSNDELWGAVENAAGMYSFIKVGPAGATVLSQGQLDTLRLPTGPFGGTARFALDCAGTAAVDGTFKMQLHAPGTDVGVQYFAAPGDGPASFDRIGVYAESGNEPSTLSVDFVLAFGGTGDTSMSPAAVELLTHIPTDWQPDCFEAFASAFEIGAHADILCQLNGGRSDYAEYTSFDTNANMDASFQHLVDTWGVEEQGNLCDTGPHRGTYSIGGQPAGQVLCAPAETGTRFDWTLDSLVILSELIDLEGSYPDMYQDWLMAGPN